MFSKQANYSKLKTNLRLVINRLKLLEKKKTEMALKARKEIADYVQAGKDDRARIRVEHIVREDYLVEAMEMIEMYCDLLLARFGLISSQKDLDPGLEEAVATLIWATPRLQADVAEFKPVAEQLTLKYSKEFAQACLSNSMGNVSEKVMHKLSVQAPPKVLVERYLVEIAKSYGVPFTPDASVMAEEEQGGLLDIDPPYNKRGGGGGGGGGGGFSEPSSGLPSVPSMGSGGGVGIGTPYPPPSSMMGPNAAASGGGGLPYPPTPDQQQYGAGTYPGSNAAAAASSPAGSIGGGGAGGGSGPGGFCAQPPPYQPEAGPLPAKSPANNDGHGCLNLPELPQVPQSFDNFGSQHQQQQHQQPPPPSDAAAGGTSADVDFDDLARRFEELKKRK